MVLAEQNGHWGWNKERKGELSWVRVEKNVGLASVIDFFSEERRTVRRPL